MTKQRAPMLETPEPLGNLTYCLPMKSHKTIGVQRFRNPRTGKEFEFTMFVSDMDWASIVFPLTSNNEVIAINQFRCAKTSYILELPGGCPNSETETPEEVAARELLEETGYQAGDIVRLLPNTVWTDPASTSHGNIYLSVATDCTYIKMPQRDPLEFIETLVVSLENWLEMIRDGTVRDQKSILATFLAISRLFPA
ncbi:MAG: NUDIX hydrolase [Patescibacteria group bacterium]